MLEDMVIVHATRCRNHILTGLDGDRFAWLLDILVPSGLAVLQRGSGNELGAVMTSDTYDEVTEPFLLELQRRFAGWTDLGTVRTPPVQIRRGANGASYQMQYRRMLIATNDQDWREVMETAERVYREGYLGWQYSLAADAREAVVELFLRDRDMVDLEIEGES